MFDTDNLPEDQNEFEETGEDNLDEPDLEDIENNSQQKIKDLRDKLKVCEKEKTQYLEDLQRVKADFLNSKKRLEEERLKDKDRQISAHIEELLPLCDSFNSAMSGESWQEVDKKWRMGVEGIFAQLQSLLNSYQVEPIDPTGEMFNPMRHEAFNTEPVASEADNDKILKTMQLGYERTINGEKKLIRPARVVVGKFDN